MSNVWQTITSTNVDQDVRRHMASLGFSKLTTLIKASCHHDAGKITVSVFLTYSPQKGHGDCLQWEREYKHVRFACTCVGYPCGFVGRFHSAISILHTVQSEHNFRHYVYDLLVYISLNDNEYNSIQILLKCVPNGPIHNKSSFVEAMAWHQTNDKPLHGPMMI